MHVVIQEDKSARSQLQWVSCAILGLLWHTMLYACMYVCVLYSLLLRMWHAFLIDNVSLDEYGIVHLTTNKHMLKMVRMVIIITRVMNCIIGLLWIKENDALPYYAYA